MHGLTQNPLTGEIQLQFTGMNRISRIKNPVITRKPPKHSKRSDLPYPARFKTKALTPRAVPSAAINFSL